jgi:hypothetical protein
MNTQNKSNRKKNQRQTPGHRQAVAKKAAHPPVLHIYLGSHEQERPETRMTR